MNPSKYTSGGVLRKRPSIFANLNGKVRVFEKGGWNDDQAARRELNDEFEIPNDKMPTEGMIVITAGKNGACPDGEVEVVAVTDRTGPGAEVDMGAGERTVDKVADEEGVIGKDFVEYVAVQVGKGGVIQREHLCRMVRQI